MMRYQRQLVEFITLGLTVKEKLAGSSQGQNRSIWILASGPLTHVKIGQEHQKDSCHQEADAYWAEEHSRPLLCLDRHLP